MDEKIRQAYRKWYGIGGPYSNEEIFTAGFRAGERAEQEAHQFNREDGPQQKEKVTRRRGKRQGV